MSPCYHPLQAYLATDGEEKGQIVFARQSGRIYLETQLPCGTCLGCRLDYSRQWSIRCMHEAELHDDNCMLTLTYDDVHLPEDGSLQPRDVVLFLKRLRKTLSPQKISYYMAGEYGENTSRPHYHVLIFGADFADVELYSHPFARVDIDVVERAWGLGHVRRDPLTMETAAYVTRYCLKKQNKEIDYVDKSSGVIRRREFVRMSRRPAIGRRWYEQNSKDTYRDDTVVLKDLVSRPPRYYDKVKKQIEGDDALKEIKRKRLKESFARRHDTTPARLAVREKIAKAKNALLKRSYENA